MGNIEHYPDHAAFQFDADLRLRGTLGGCVKHCAELSSHQKEAQSGLTSWTVSEHFCYFQQLSHRAHQLWNKNWTIKLCSSVTELSTGQGNMTQAGTWGKHTFIGFDVHGVNEEIFKLQLNSDPFLSILKTLQKLFKNLFPFKL